MNWGIIFGKQILERGRQYYNSGKVKDLTYMGGGYEATVRGSIPYHVEIRISGKVIRSMSCTCPYAQEHRYCKHMAAVLTAIERRRAQEKLKEDAASAPDDAEEQAEDPFAKIIQEMPGYSYFNLAEMTKSLQLTKGLCREAQGMIDKGLVVLDQVTVGYLNENRREENKGVAEGRFLAGGRSYGLRITFDKKQICEARCETPGCGRFFWGTGYMRGYGEGRGLCVHELALLYLLADYLKEYSPGDTTDLSGARILWQFRGKRGLEGQPETQEQGEDLKLEPRLENNGEQLKISFRIGREKMYLVKNLTILVDAVNDRQEISFGANLRVNFARDRFESESRGYYNFIAQAVKDEEYRQENLSQYINRYNLPGLFIKGSIDLFGGRLDEVYTLLEGRTAEYLESNRPGVARTREKSVLSVRDQAPELRLRIEKDIDSNGVFQGVHVKGQLSRLWEGAHYYYYIENGFLNRVSPEYVEEFLPLYGAETMDGVSFRIGRKNLAEFYYSLLPALRRYGTVEEADAKEVAEYLPPEAVFHFYLDAEGRNASCQVRAVYGTEDVSVMDLLSKRHVAAKEDFRDVNREREMIGQVRRYFPETDRDADVFHCGWDEEAVYRALDQGVDQLLMLGEVHSTDRFRHLHIRRRPKVSVGVSLGSDLMDLEISSEDISREELLEILSGYRQKKRFFRLKNGDFLNMEDDSLEALCQMMEGLGLSPKEFVQGKVQLPMYRALYLDQMMEQSEGLYATRDRRFKKLVKEFKTVNESDFEVPESLRKTMRKYQTTGYKWLRTLDAYGFGGILADDMGLGKTLQMISVLLAYKKEGGDGTSLIVSPASLVFNWQEELRRFAPELSVCLIVGTQKERAGKLRRYQEYDVLVTSYDLLKRDIVEYEDCRFVYQVIDEAQYIKNHATAASKAVKILRSRTRFALTGTPIENRLSELWSIFDYLMPGFLYGYETFKKDLEIPIAKNHDEEATACLKKMVSPFILRRLKQEVLKDLPEKLEETRFARMEDKQQKLYDAQVVHMRKLLNEQNDENFQKNKMRVLAELTKIRQVCCDPTLYLENYSGGSAKREACIDLVRSAIAGEHKILLFSQFTSMLELLEEDLAAEKITYYKITGATSKEKRVELVRRFNEDDTPVFLISLKAGGTGLNLTGADVVIHYDPWWNLAVQNQATDRAHRIGQKKVVSVYRLIVKDSIEEKILQMQEAKKNLADEILSGETGGLAGMSREELLQLIG